eukprot:1956484-Rhodomonas_salina.1
MALHTLYRSPVLPQYRPTCGTLFECAVAGCVRYCRGVLVAVPWTCALLTWSIVCGTDVEYCV